MRMLDRGVARRQAAGELEVSRQTASVRTKALAKDPQARRRRFQSAQRRIQQISASRQ
jgi:orotate phosphoribosyltransferase-like protein